MAPKKKAASAASATAVGDVDAEQQQQHNGSEQQAMTSPTATTAAAVTSPESGNNNNNNTAAVTASTTPPPPAASTSAVTTFARLQQALAADAEAINQHVGDVLELMQAAEGSSGNSTAATTAAAPLLLRVRALEFIASHVGHLHDTAALKRIVTSVVRILSADEDTTPLLVAATQCLAGLGAIAVHDKSCEYLAREGADVLMQVMLDTDAFAEPVRVAAGKALDALTASALRPVVTKLLHWLSDAREEDTAEQLTRERRLALARLTKLTMSPLAASLWTGETQQFVLSLLPRILASVDAHEYAQLLRVVAHLPLVAAQHGAPLLQCVLQDVATGKPDSDRALEALSLAARFVSLPPATTTATTAAAATTAATTTTPAAVDGNEEEQPQHVSTATTSEADKKSSDDGSSAATAALTAAAAELMATLNKAQLLTTAVAGDGARGVHHARVVLLACRLASVLPADAVEQLTTYTLAQLQSLLCSSNSSSSASQQQQTQAVETTNDDEEGADAAAAAAAAAVPLHERNTSTIESLLFAIVALVRARPVEMRQRLQSTQLQHCLTALTRCAADTLSLARYAVTKLSQRAAEAATTAAAAAAAAADGAAQTEKASDYAELLTSLHNIHALAEALASSRLPLSELRPSWFGGNNNNNNSAAARRGHALHKHGNSNSHEVAMRLLPPQPGTRAAAAAAHGGGGGARRKRSRSPSRHGDRDGRNAAQRSRSGRNSATLAAARRRRH